MTPTVRRSGPIPPLALITDVVDDVALARAARCWANPHDGRITVDPTPATSTSAFLARDILAALGRTAYVPTHGRVITAQPAWRAASCWITIDDIRQMAVLRAHLLTPERAEQLSALRKVTGIRLILVASGATAGECARLKAHLAEAGLAGELKHLDATAALHLFTHHAAPRPNLPHPRAARQRPSTTRSSAVAPAHSAPPARRPSPDLSSQHRAGLLAAQNWLSRHQSMSPALPDQRDVELFLSRLTVLCPTTEHTAARIRGAQDGFARTGLRLTLAADPAAAGGRGSAQSRSPRTSRTASAGLYPARPKPPLWPPSCAPEPPPTASSTPPSTTYITTAPNSPFPSPSAASTTRTIHRPASGTRSRPAPGPT
ncbi:hypothetical protein ACFV8E_07425 [Streptomyces sp. NPDC059849]|uniref:hypothetical protein n=1 Tax=Streptomyces sp. NPDC059849 TaxID=3346969 RepID=UPI00364D1A7C